LNCDAVRLPAFSFAALIFVGATLCASDLGHSVVLSLNRYGILSGPYLTYKHETVLPVLLAGLIVCTIATLGIFGNALAPAAGLRCDWLEDAAFRFERVGFFELFPLILAGQLALLLVLETAEQIVAFGHPLGFIATMGAPLWIALFVHSMAALASALFVAFFCRGIVRAAKNIAHNASFRFLRLSLAAGGCAIVARRFILFQRSCKLLPPLAQHLANRPPPATAIRIA